MKEVQADVFVDRLNDDLDCGHDEQLSQARLANHGAERDQHGGRTKVRYQKPITYSYYLDK